MRRLHQMYRHFDKDDNLLYIGISINAVNRLRTHQTASGWYKSIHKIVIENYPSREELESAEIKAIQDENPKHNMCRYTGESGSFKGDGLTIEENEQLERIIIQQCKLARKKMIKLFKSAVKGNKESLMEVIYIIGGTVMGKGSGRRPTDDKKFSDNFDRIFGSKPNDKQFEGKLDGNKSDTKNPKKTKG